MPRHTHGRRREAAPIFVRLVRPSEGFVLLSGFIWGGERRAHESVRLTPGVAYELGRELVDTAESLLMAESWGPARGAPQAGSPAIRPA